jgi:hypothetical protein
VTKQICSKSSAVFVLVLMASAATRTFALSAINLSQGSSLSAGQSGGTYPDPTGEGDGGNLAVHSR